MFRKAIVIVISCQSDIYEKSSEIRKIAGKWGLVEKIACICSVFCQFNEQKCRFVTNLILCGFARYRIM